MPIYKLTAWLNVISTTTIVRFSQAMGYSGFAEMQRDAQLAVLDMAPACQTLEEDTVSVDGEYSVEQSFKMSIANLEKTLSIINRDELARLLEGGQIILFPDRRVDRHADPCPLCRLRLTS